MVEIRYFILSRVNEIRKNYGRNPLHVHEEMSDSAQRHAQFILEEMLKGNNHLFGSVCHHNLFYHGEYSTENTGFSEGNLSLERHIESVLGYFYVNRMDRGHFDNMLNSWKNIGTDISYAYEKVILVQRFAE